MGKEAQAGIKASSCLQGGKKSTAPPYDIMALGALAGAMFLWSGTFVAIKAALEYVHPVLLIFARMTVSTLCLLPFWRSWVRRTRYTPGDWRLILLLVISEPCLYFLFEGYALKYTTASQAGLVTALLPLLVGVSAFIVLKERLCLKAWTGFFLAVAGVALLTMAGEETAAAPNPALGNTLEFCAMLMACVYTLCVRKLPYYAPFFITALQSAGGMLFFGGLTMLPAIPFPPTLPPLSILLAVAFLSFSTIVAYGLYNTGIARIGAGQAAAMTSLIPALTLIMGIIFLGESLNFAQSLALVPLGIGVVLSQARS